MNEPHAVTVNAPTMPKGGGAIQSIGKGWGEVGAHGSAIYEISLPVSPGRGFAPSLSLTYNSSAGNGIFGLGWGVALPTVARRTANGVPAYTNQDDIVGAGGVVWMPERDVDGTIVSSRVSHYNELALDATYAVVRHFPRLESSFDRIEHWSSDGDKPGFWLIHGADGTLHIFGKNPALRHADRQDASRVGEWLLEESVNPLGEHILYRYKAEDHAPHSTAQRYLNHVCYGNFDADAHLYAWKPERLAPVQWHFELVFDYGERSTAYSEKPAYEGQRWQTRSDAFSSFAYGFELRTERLCRQVLMFHRFPQELGAEPVLVRRLLLDYRATSLGYEQLRAAHDQAFAPSQTVACHPPLTFSYSEFANVSDAVAWQPFQTMPGLNDGEHYQLVDLYGEGLAGVLHRSQSGWYYREPLRARPHSDEVTYGPWQAVPATPNSDVPKPVRQSLQDLTGDGRLDWVVTQPGLSGFFSLDAERNWSRFAPFDALPLEFFNPQSQLADLMGEGLNDLVLIGPRSVRLYANRRAGGFSAADEVRRTEAQDSLPMAGASSSELVAFSDILGSGQHHLVRIRHDEIRCWPNLGRGRFGNSRVVGSPNLDDATFDPARIRLADLDGSGAADLIYLEADHALIFMNRCGNGFARPNALPWPQGFRYDRLCEVGTADLQGLGCASLILSVPHAGSRHWRYDFVRAKPYLLTATNNNMGAASSIRYRSSAQEWLDEKAQQIAANVAPVCQVPFAQHLVSSQSRLDEITGNRLTQRYCYRQGYYDGSEREFRGFGLVVQTDSESASEDAQSPAFTMPCLKKSWFHTGQSVSPPRADYHDEDLAAVKLGEALLCQYLSDSQADTAVASPDAATHREMARALSGRLLRVEVFGFDTLTAHETLYSVQQTRYRVRLLQPPGAHQRYARMLPLVLESISYHYEGVLDDPQCQHTLNLSHDPFGALTHSVSVHCARRKSTGDAPPPGNAHQQQWWRDAHDPAQQFHHLSETRAEYIHLENPQGWRLGLTYRQRTNALKRSKDAMTGGLATAGISYEHFIELVNQTDWQTDAVLTGLSVQRYRHTSQEETLADGVAHFEALVDSLETAELDETALQAFKLLGQNVRPKGKLLERSGYQRMVDFLPLTSPARKLWSVTRGMTTYAKRAGFYRPLSFQASKSHGKTTFTYDAHACCLTRFSLPDGCTTQAVYDYRSFAPLHITDANGNVQEALYNGFGQTLASTFHGRERGEGVGFKPVAQYRYPSLSSPYAAIDDAGKAPQEVATAIFHASFSWMGRVSQEAMADVDWLARSVARGDVLADGFICAQARQRLAGSEELDADVQKLKRECDTAHREPVHVAVLTADRYPDDPRQQIRITVACHDGFGRPLQSKQRVEAGKAYVVNAKGGLVLESGKPIERTAPTRWRISARLEYNDKGLPIRTYRPYFADQCRYIKDESLREFGHCDLQFYDPLGRPTHTRLARQGELSYMRRLTRHPWYTVNEDENDTLQEIAALENVVAGGEE